RLAERREAAGEDRDDREGDGEVGEAGPRPVQLLLVAELGEVLLVVVQLNCHGCSHASGRHGVRPASSGATRAMLGVTAPNWYGFGPLGADRAWREPPSDSAVHRTESVGARGPLGQTTAS